MAWHERNDEGAVQQPYKRPRCKFRGTGLVFFLHMRERFGLVKPWALLSRHSLRTIHRQTRQPLSQFMGYGHGPWAMGLSRCAFRARPRGSGPACAHRPRTASPRQDAIQRLPLCERALQVYLRRAPRVQSCQVRSRCRCCSQCYP